MRRYAHSIGVRRDWETRMDRGKRNNAGRRNRALEFSSSTAICNSIFLSSFLGVLNPSVYNFSHLIWFKQGYAWLNTQILAVIGLFALINAINYRCKRATRWWCGMDSRNDVLTFSCSNSISVSINSILWVHLLQGYRSFFCVARGKGSGLFLKNWRNGKHTPVQGRLWAKLRTPSEAQFHDRKA